MQMMGASGNMGALAADKGAADHEQRLVTIAKQAATQSRSRVQRTAVRGKIIARIADELRAKIAAREPLNSVDRDDIDWMSTAVREQPPAAESLTADPRQGFDPGKPIQIRNGRLEQQGQPIFLFNVMNLDAPWKSEMGVNLASETFGPFWTLPGPDFDRLRATEFRKPFLENRQVVHETLYAAHRLPKWLRDAYPDLNRCGLGWLGYNIESPAAGRAHQATIQAVLGNAKAKHPFPTLLCCLANEPTYSGRDPDTTDAAWRRWLSDHHGSIGALNKRWRTRYRSFNDVAVPDYITSGRPVGANDVQLPTRGGDLPAFYDWTRFNDERLAGFLLKLREEMNRACPGALYHVKWLSDYPTFSRSVARATNPVPIARAMDLLDSDTWTLYGGPDPDFALSWQRPLLTQTILRSLYPHKPQMNSENHLVSAPRNEDPSSTRHTQPWSFFRLALWLQAVHNLQASQIWAWDFGTEGEKRNQDAGTDLLHRAQGLDALAQAIFEFAGLRREVAELQQQKAEIAVVFSHASFAREAGAIAEAVPPTNPQFGNAQVASNGDRLPGQATHLSTFCDVMYALMHFGRPVDVVLEESEQDTSHYRAIIVPNAEWIESGLAAKLVKSAANGASLIAVGQKPQFDPYGQRDNALSPARFEEVPVPKNTRGAHQFLREWLVRKDLMPQFVPVDSAGQIPYALMWRVIPQSAGHLVFLANLGREAQRVSLKPENRLIDAIDGRPAAPELTLPSLDVRLVRMPSQSAGSEP
jgi:hypothetical protein